MSMFEVVQATVFARRTSTPAMSAISVPYRLAVYLACTAATLVANYLLGKDLAWDTLNYHLYAGFSALNDRFAQDYFAAGPQSYFNPYAYVPFYAMVHAGLSSLEISSILALVHSVIFWLTFELAMYVCPSDDRRLRMAVGICAIVLAFINPILVQQIGSTFADITTAELVLGGWLLLAQAVRVPHSARVICAGLLLGAATALKPTNSVHAIAACAVFIMLPFDLRGRLRQGIFYCLSLGAGFVIIATPWSYRLEKMFGNPLFPLMNNVFRSAEFTTEPLRHFRFIPYTFAEALWRPFAIVDPVRMVHEELSSPDLRYAVLVVLVVGFLSHWLWRRFSRPSNPPPAEGFAASARVLAALGCGFGADWMMWLGASGNGRYFLPMACIAAVLIVGLLFRLFATRPKVRNYILAAIFGLQAVQLWMGAEFRWNEVPWHGPWLSIEVPEKLRNESSLYLTEGTMSNSFLAAYLAEGSGLINFTGGYPLGPAGENGARIAALINHYGPHLRVLAVGDKVYEDSESNEPRRSQVDAPLIRFGLRVDTSDCATISLNGPQSDQEPLAESSKPDQHAPGNTAHLVSCRIVPDATDHSAELAQQRAADIILDRLEDACPRLFQPRRMLTERRGHAWIRHYLNTDVWAWVSQGGVKFYQANSGIFRTWVGRESDWAKASLRLSCGRRDDIYFAKVLDSNEAR
jgi:hypothetical protein